MDRENPMDFEYYMQRAKDCSDYREIEEDYMDGHVLEELKELIVDFLNKHRRGYYVRGTSYNPGSLRILLLSRRLF